MKKVLILTYFFPPATFTGSYRVYSWAKYLCESGYYPIIITRNWDVDITDYQDVARSAGHKINHTKYENYEVYNIPYKGNLRDKLYEKYGDDRWILIRRLLTFNELVLQNFIFSILPYYNLFSFAKKYLAKNQDISLLVSSGRPFSLFGFCYKIAVKFKIPWIADYRDDWNTSQWLRNATILEKILMKFDKPSEKKWLTNASCFTTISDSYVKRISEFVKKPGFSIMNGFDEDDFTELLKTKQRKEFTIFFSGTLYDSQPVEIFVDGYKKFVNNLKEEQRVKLIFLGLDIEKKQTQRINRLLAGYEEYFEITDRIDKKSALAFLSEGHVFLMFSHTDIIGVTSSKIFDYLALLKPIILCPTDHDILEQIVSSTNAGYICNTSVELTELLNTLYSEFVNTGVINHKPDPDKISIFSRRNQTKKLAVVLNKIVSGEIVNAAFTKEEQVIRNAIFGIIHKAGGLTLLKSMRNMRAGIPVACFHRVTPPIDLSYPSIHPEVFRAFIKTVSKEYDIIPLAEIDNLPESIRKPLVLTFDDGYSDFINYALPVLKEFNVASLNSIIVNCAETGKPFWTQHLNFALNYIFLNNRRFNFSFKNIAIENSNKLISPRHTSQMIYNKLLYWKCEDREEFIATLEKEFEVPVPENWNIMNWTEIKYCVGEGVAIGSHSLSHDSLITIENQEVLKNEIIESKKILQKNLDTDINTFTFPNGLYNDQCLELICDAGYKNVLGTQEKLYYTGDNNSGIPIIPRISINKKTLSENLLAIENFHNYIKAISRRKK